MCYSLMLLYFDIVHLMTGKRNNKRERKKKEKKEKDGDDVTVTSR